MANINPNVLRAIVNEWRNAGMSPQGIAGVLYNIGEESSFNPSLRHPDQPKFGGEAHFAHGLYQEGGDEWNNFSNWLAKNGGGDWRDPVLQSRFAAQNLKNHYGNVWAQMQNAASPEQAASSYARGYLKPAAQYLQNRLNTIRAKGVPTLESYGDTGSSTAAQPEATETTGAATPTDAATPTGAATPTDKSAPAPSTAGAGASPSDQKQGPAYGPPVPPGNIVQNGKMYTPVRSGTGDAAARGPKGKGGLPGATAMSQQGGMPYIPILSELSHLFFPQNYPGRPAAMTSYSPGATVPAGAPQHWVGDRDTGHWETGPIAPAAGKPAAAPAPAAGKPAAAPAPAAGTAATIPGTAGQVPIEGGAKMMPGTVGPRAWEPSALQRMMGMGAGPLGQSRSVSDPWPAGTTPAATMIPGTAGQVPLEEGLNIMSGTVGPRGAGPSTVQQMMGMGAGPLATPAATTPNAAVAGPATPPPGYSAASGPNPPSPYGPGGPYANPYNPGGLATPSELAARGVPSPAQMLNALNPVSSASASELPPGPTATAAAQAVASRLRSQSALEQMMGMGAGAVAPRLRSQSALEQMLSSAGPRGPGATMIPGTAGQVPIEPGINIMPGTVGPRGAGPSTVQQMMGMGAAPLGQSRSVLNAINPVQADAARLQGASFAERFGGGPGAPGPGQYSNPALASALLARQQPPALRPPLPQQPGDTTMIAGIPLPRPRPQMPANPPQQIPPPQTSPQNLPPPNIPGMPEIPPPGGPAGSFAERFAGAQYQNPDLAKTLAAVAARPQMTSQGGPVPPAGPSEPPTLQQIIADQGHRSTATGPVPTSSGDAGAPALTAPQFMTPAAAARQKFLQDRAQALSGPNAPLAPSPQPQPPPAQAQGSTDDINAAMLEYLRRQAQQSQNSSQDYGSWAY